MRSALLIGAVFLAAFIACFLALQHADQLTCALPPSGAETHDTPAFHLKNSPSVSSATGLPEVNNNHQVDIAINELGLGALVVAIGTVIVFLKSTVFGGL